MNQLKEELDRFMGGTRLNPPTEKMYEFLQELSSEGKLFDYSEQDWVEAGRSYGMSDDEISNWVETAASWLTDTTDHGDYEPETSAWAGKGVQPTQNPSPATRGISAKQARRGTPEFAQLLGQLEDEWEFDDEELDNIVEIRHDGETFSIRMKGEDTWEFVEDDEEDEDGPTDEDELDPSDDEDFGEEE